MVAVREFSWEEISGPDFGNPARQAWPQAVAQVEEQLCAKLRVEVLPERMRKALDLVRADAVTLQADGSASVQSGNQTYTLAPECKCGDAKHRAELCKHALAVELHRRALALVEGTAPAPASSATPAAPSASLPAAAAALPLAALPTAPSAPASAAWDVHEAPVSSCFKIRVGALEWTHTMRGTDDAELQPRLQTFLPTFRDIAAALEAMHAEREAAKAAPAPPAPQPTSAPADLQTLIQQAVQQALNGQAPGTPPPAAPAPGTAPSGPAPDDQQTGFCSMHQVPMEQKHNARGTFYGHWLADEQRHCNGRRNGRR